MKYIVLLTIPVLALSSCNTVVGLGRDIKSVGDGVENKAYGKQWNGTPRTRVTIFDKFKQPTTTVPQHVVE